MLHSVQLVDASNRLAKTLESSLLLYGTLISHEGNIRQFGIGRRQHLSVERDHESRCSATSDVYFGLAVLCVTVRSLIVFLRPKECIQGRAVSPLIVVEDLGSYSAR
jgi:hypothetical protein